MATVPVKTKRIGILTGGGDAPGLNAVIRAVAKTAMFQYGLEVVTGSLMSIVFMPTTVLKAAKRARAVRAAEPMAKPLPVAAVVLPTASSLSVRLRTSFSNSAISAKPPALSAIGP